MRQTHPLSMWGTTSMRTMQCGKLCGSSSTAAWARAWGCSACPSIDSRLGLAMNVQSGADRDREFRFGVFGSLGVSEAFYAIAGMGKATGHHAWCTGCVTGVDHTKMFSGLSLAAGYQYVSMDPRLVGLVSGLRVEPEFLPRFGEQGQLELRRADKRRPRIQRVAPTRNDVSRRCALARRRRQT